MNSMLLIEDLSDSDICSDSLYSSIWSIDTCSDSPYTSIWSIDICSDSPYSSIWSIDTCSDSPYSSIWSVDTCSVSPYNSIWSVTSLEDVWDFDTKCYFVLSEKEDFDNICVSLIILKPPTCRKLLTYFIT